MNASPLFEAGPGGSGNGGARVPAEGALVVEAGRARALVASMRMLAATGDVGAPAVDLVEQVSATAALAREVDLALARVAREVERFSDDVPGGGLARRHGYRGAVDMLAAVLGATRAEALRLITVGRVLEEGEEVPEPDEPNLPDDGHGDDEPERGQDDDGPAGGDDDPDEGADDGPEPDDDGPDDGPDDDGPDDDGPARRKGPRYPVTHEALASGWLSVECASLIVSMLDELADSVDAEVLAQAERDLLRAAQGLSATRFARIVGAMRARLDAAAHEQRLARMRQRRMVRLWDNREGMTEIRGLLDPETAAAVRAALDALVGEDMRRSQEAVGTDTRTSDQMRADALARLCRHALGCTATDLPLSTTTVVVRVDEADLRSGLGMGEVDGSAVPVTIATLRRMAADAEVIPIVLGGASEVLDQGRRRRLFTRAQRIALGERDGGCAFCHAPPAWCHAHHIRWWGKHRGPTDISNGVLLCSHCHHTVHDQGWDIKATATDVWFIPPASVDPERRPRQGGRARFQPARSHDT